jgi:hypothetical protein
LQQQHYSSHTATTLLLQKMDFLYYMDRRLPEIEHAEEGMQLLVHKGAHAVRQLSHPLDVLTDQEGPDGEYRLLP